MPRLLIYLLSLATVAGCAAEAGPIDVGSGTGGGGFTDPAGYFSTLLDNSGDTDAADDCSTPCTFSAGPAAGVVWHVARMLVFVQDAGNWRAEYYAGLGAPLTNGIVVRVQDDSGTLVTLTNGTPVKSEGEWAAHCYDNDTNTLGAGDTAEAVRWTFEKAGAPIRLVGDNGERIEMVFSDNLSTLTHHWQRIQGLVVN